MRCPEIATRFVATENNRGINCLTECSIFGPHKVSSVRDSDRQAERVQDWGLRMEDALVEVTTSKQTLKISFLCYSYSNLQSVIIACTYEVCVSNKSIHQSEPRLQVTNTRDKTYSLITVIYNKSYKNIISFGSHERSCVSLNVKYRANRFIILKLRLHTKYLYRTILSLIYSSCYLKTKYNDCPVYSAFL
jgi:hypothetical protein